ncbi:PAS domain S-box [Burkholderiales bacterium JOSHI_001]|nr:PAS domain S-box [Burkholderiales bacterium JOSHI_001]
MRRRFLPWPHRLQHQVPLLLALVLLAAMAALYLISTARLAGSVADAARGRALAVAQAAARVGGSAMETEDAQGAERAMVELTHLPGVLRIDTFRASGANLMSLHVTPVGQVLFGRDPGDVRPPRPGESQTQQVRLGEVDAMRVWAPVGPAARHGMLAVTFSMEGERAQLEQLRFESLLASAGVGLFTVVIVYAFMLRALAPLKRLAAFSHELARHTGGQLPPDGSSQEVSDLTTSLNHASARLHAQLEAIQSTELRTVAILNAAPDAIVGLDGKGCISLVNPAVASVFGHDPNDLIGQPLTRLLPQIHAEEAERLTLQGLYVRSSGAHVARLETTACRHDGTEFPAEVSLARTETEGGTRYACVVRDVTEARMTYAMLNLYNRALECTTNGVVISDMSLAGSPVFYANPAFARITGYEVGETIGRNCKFLQRDDDEQPEIQVLRDAVARGEPATVVLRNYRKDGSLFFNELAIAPVAASDGAVKHYVGVLNDVSERERSRLALAERSARLNAVFDLSPDGYLVFDREGALLFCNRAFRGMVGWDVDDVIDGITLAQFDQRLRELCDPARPYPEVSRMQGAAGESYDTEDLLEMVRPRRAVLTRLARCNVGAQGESILYFRDVTRETEVDRMKSEFLTTAAHELRTPMVSVFGFTELLLNRPVPEAKRRDVLETIHRQASLLINMVNELLDLARIEARQGKDLKREPHPLGELIERTVHALMVKGDPRSVVQDVRHGALALSVDAEKTVQALTNVLSNAYKYSPAGGEIRLRTLDGQVGGRPAVGVRISDQGIGMSPEQTARVFERFYRADPSGNIPGTGLGMSLVKEIMELQGGAVVLASEPGRGTEVTLWFPLMDPEAPRLAAPQADDIIDASR